MLTVNEALKLVIENAAPLPVVDCPLERALGRTLAEEIAADADQPPFDKALVDGYAARLADLEGLPRRLKVGETILAGQTPSRPLGEGETAEITTGAPLPPGAEVVVMHERTTRFGDEIEVEDQEIRPDLNRLRRGEVYKKGERLLDPGPRLAPWRLGLLAAVGRSSVRVVDRPTVAVVPTGDELVDFHQTPGPGQIRNSNAAMLAGLVADHGAEPWTSPILPDEPKALRRGLREALDRDVALIIGGVSAGQKDLVPNMLQELGARQVFHKIRIRPGKPLWFGIGPHREGRPPALIFGLPGNPLSGLVNFLVFVRPALDILKGRPGETPGPIPARLGRRHHHRGFFRVHLPARIVQDTPAPGAPPTIVPLDSRGSADLYAAALADGFLVLPEEERTFEAGEIVDFLPLG